MVEQARFAHLTNGEHVCRIAHVYHRCCFWLENGGSDAISRPFVDFDLSTSRALVFAFSATHARLWPGSVSLAQVKNFAKDKRDIRIQCLVRHGHTNHINDIELQMRLRLRKSFYRISIVYPLTGLCLHSFEIKRHWQSACTDVQGGIETHFERFASQLTSLWQSYVEIFKL